MVALGSKKLHLNLTSFTYVVYICHMAFMAESSNNCQYLSVIPISNRGVRFVIFGIELNQDQLLMFFLFYIKYLQARIFLTSTTNTA